MSSRAQASGHVLTEQDAAIAKGMLIRGDRQHDIAAYFGVNGGRIAEISTGHQFATVQPASPAALPPPGPYPRPHELINEVEILRRKITEIENS